MAGSTDDFASLLTFAVRSISAKSNLPLKAVQNELGKAIGKRSGAMIEHWRKQGKGPPTKIDDLERLTLEIARRLDSDRTWLERFLTLGKHPSATAFLAQNIGHAAPLPPVQLLPDSELPPVGALPAGSIMPHSKNPHFVGRNADLLALADMLNTHNTMAISPMPETAAATGLGGVGKTQLACEFVHRFGRYFPGGVFWMSFEQAEAVPGEIAACGGPEGMDLADNFQKLSIDEQLKKVQVAWQEPIARLLVFDNCEDPALFAKWRPKFGGCRILITSRRGNWDSVLGVEMQALDTLQRSASVILLGKHRADIRPRIADAIAEELGDLPLALHLAGHYMRQFTRTLEPAHYLEQLRDAMSLHHPSMTSGSAVSPTGHDQHVWRTFAMSYQLLDRSKESDSLAHQLLVNTAHFAPGELIWYELLVATLGLGPNLNLAIEAAFNRLIDVGLIETEQNNRLRMHRLVAKFVRDIAADEIQESVEAVESAVCDYIKQMNKAVEPLPLLSWQLHLRTVADIAQAREDAEGARLCSELGTHLWQISDFKGAQLYLEKALEIRLQIFGENHRETAESLVSVGRVYRALGDFKEAQRYFMRSLAVCELIFGPDDLLTAESHDALGRSYIELGELDTALIHLVQALDTAEKIQQRETEQLAEYQNNVGHIYYLLGDIDRAQRHWEAAIRINEVVLGPEHPFTSLPMHNLGVVLRNTGRFQDAYPFLSRALEIRLTAYGEEHFDTTNTFEALARLLCLLERNEEAEPLARKAVALYEQILEPNHTRTTNGYLTLGMVMGALGDTQAAQIWLNKAYTIRREALGDDHHMTNEALQVADELGLELSPGQKG